MRVTSTFSPHIAIVREYTARYAHVDVDAGRQSFAWQGHTRNFAMMVLLKIIGP